MIGYFVTFAILWFVGSVGFTLWNLSEYYDNQKWQSYRRMVPINKRRVRYGVYSAMLSPFGGMLAPATVLYLLFLGVKKVLHVAFGDDE